MKTLICLLFAIVLLQEVSSQANKCYNCNSAADRSRCDSPINKDKVKIEECPNSDDSVCVVFSYDMGSLSYTERKCSNATVLEMNTCRYLAVVHEDIPGLKNWKCLSCNSDLCNAGHAFDMKTAYKFAILLLFLLKLL